MGEHRRMTPTDKVYIAGHGGLVGSAISRSLREAGYNNLVTFSRGELDLCRQQPVEEMLSAERPDVVILAAAKVGGIHANNTRRAEFIRDNLLIQNNIIEASRLAGVQRLLFLGSSCIYPRLAPQPMKEEHLLTGALEPTNEPYAIAKIAGIKLCEAYNAQYGTQYLSVMPTNLYGPGDNFDLENSHVLPAFIRRFIEAKSSGLQKVTIWGTGSAKREFLYVDDLAQAVKFLLEETDEVQLVNIGTGLDCSILQLAQIIAKEVGFEGEIALDPSKPDGTPRKLLDVSRLKQLGFVAPTTLKEGIHRTVAWYRDHQATARGVTGPA